MKLVRVNMQLQSITKLLLDRIKLEHNFKTYDQTLDYLLFIEKQYIPKE